MAGSRGGRLTGIVFAFAGVAVGIGPAFDLATLNSTNPDKGSVKFDVTEAIQLGVGVALVLVCLYFMLRRQKNSA